MAARVGGSRSARLSMLFSRPSRQANRQQYVLFLVFRSDTLTVGWCTKSESIEATEEDDRVVFHIVKHFR